MRIHLLVITFLLSGMVSAQSGKLRKADEDYRSLSYVTAAARYEKLLGKKADSPQLKSRLANSYYQMGKMADAERVYAMYVPAGGASANDIYQYAQALKENGKYAESDNWMRRFALADPADLRAIEFASRQNYLDQIAREGEHFTVGKLSVNTPQADFGGYPHPNGKDIYFVTSRTNRVFVKRRWSWNNTPFLDIYRAERTGENQLANASPFTSRVNSKYHEGPLCFSADGKTVYFTRNNVSKGSRRKDEKGVQQLKMYIADVNASGNWDNEREFPYNSREYSTGHPALSADGKTLYFASTIPGGFGGADIYKVAVNADGTFGPMVNLGKDINTEGQEMFPWVGQNAELFFASDGHTGLGGLDIFVALNDEEGVFRKIVNAGYPLNSSNDDFAFAQLADGKTGYFSSNRPGGEGDDDIYSCLLIRPFKSALVVKGVATEAGTGIILAGTPVRLLNEDGTTAAEAVSDANGNYAFAVEPEKDYRITARRNDYFDNTVGLTTKGLPVNTEEVRRDIALEKDPGIALHARVTDAATKNPLEGVRIRIVDNMTNTVLIETFTTSAGDVLKGLAGKKINDQLSYTITVAKDGYLGKMVVFNTKVLRPGVINVEQSLDLGMQKMEIGGDLAKLIDIKPIYFDYGKYLIRPDAAKELDKIVKVMTDYPNLEIELGSHTDCRGSIASNEKLSDNRARASAAYVKARITNPDRIYGKGYGESKLKNGCACEGTVKSTCSEAEHQENRRTEFIITKM